MELDRIIAVWKMAGEQDSDEEINRILENKDAKMFCRS
jgi:hypothetical protein